jgi:hypothetical protein
VAGGEGFVQDVEDVGVFCGAQEEIPKALMYSKNEVRVDLSPLPNLSQLLVLLKSFGVTRFTLSPTPEAEASQLVRFRLADFSTRMKTFDNGEKRTWGWPQDPEMVQRCEARNSPVPRRAIRVPCWSWSTEALRLLENGFPDWLNEVVIGNIRWSFFSGLDLKLNLPRTDAPYFLNMIPAQIQQLQSLGLQCKVKGAMAGSISVQDRTKDRQPRWYFGPHLKEPLNSDRLLRPFWWKDHHDALIMAQVATEQWHWHSSHERFTASVSSYDMEKYETIAADQRREGIGYYGVFPNGIGAYIHKRALELGAHKLVSLLPEWRICPICANEFHETSTRAKYLGWNQLDICQPCLDESLHRGETDDLSRDEIAQYLRDLAELLERIPPLNFGVPSAKASNLIGLSTGQRMKILMLLRKRPTMSLVRYHFSSWFQALVEAGVLGSDAKRNSMGTTCVAKDGHLCLSIAEKTIDDFLSQRGIVHAREVPYGSGKFRADFVIRETVIEYFGLMDRSDYQLKAETKMEFCKRESIPFIAIYPEDLIDDRLLEEKLQIVTPAVGEHL